MESRVVSTQGKVDPGKQSKECRVAGVRLFEMKVRNVPEFDTPPPRLTRDRRDAKHKNTALVGGKRKVRA